jgi:hypothetical protein
VVFNKKVLSSPMVIIYSYKTLVLIKIWRAPSEAEAEALINLLSTSVF